MLAQICSDSVINEIRLRNFIRYLSVYVSFPCEVLDVEICLKILCKKYSPLVVTWWCKIKHYGYTERYKVFNFVKFLSFMPANMTKVIIKKKMVVLLKHLCFIF
jgi:hypothetical protein